LTATFLPLSEPSKTTVPPEPKPRILVSSMIIFGGASFSITIGGGSYSFISLLLIG
jgi:hypothetical protein